MNECEEHPDKKKDYYRESLELECHRKMKILIDLPFFVSQQLTRIRRKKNESLG